MRICVPQVQGRGSGLGNELIPWAKAFIASRELGAHLLHPAWGLSQRGYRRYFGSPRFDWVLPRVLPMILPTYTFTETDYRRTGVLDFGTAVQIFSRQSGLMEKRSYVLLLEGMWGGYESICSAKDFIRATLHNTRYTQDNLYALRRQFEGETLHVAIHIRRGDFKSATPDTDYRGQFNVCLPLNWYSHICRLLRAEFAEEVTFLLFTDSDESSLAEFITEFRPLTTFQRMHTVCSDLLAMADADLLVCSLSSYSMWAAFLSEGPYLWFKPHLHEEDGFYSIWGHELAQASPDGVTARHVAALKRNQHVGLQRGYAVGDRETLPEELLEQLRESLKLKSACTNLIRYGVIPKENAWRNTSPVTRRSNRY